MKKPKEQSEYDKLRRHLDKVQREFEKQKLLLEQEEMEKATKHAQTLIKTATSREDLRTKLTEWLGGSYPETIDTILYRRFPMTKLEKALK
jgi:hypothetical protein